MIYNLLSEKQRILPVCQAMSKTLEHFRMELPQVPGSFNRNAESIMKRLAGASHVCQLRVLERFFLVLQKITQKEEVPDANQWVCLLRFLRALQNHIQEIMNGRNTPIVMTMSYYNLCNAYGIGVELGIAGELFFPFRINGYPEKIRQTAIEPSAFKASANDYLQQFTVAHMQFVKTKSMDYIGDMRQCLLTLEPKTPHSEYHIFFASSIAFLDFVIQIKSVDQYNDWAIQGIVQELMRISQGEKAPRETLISALFYVIAQAKPGISARCQTLLEKYELPSYLADPNGVDAVIVDKFLSVMIRAQDVLSDAITQNNFEDLIALSDELVSKSDHLKNPGFSKQCFSLQKIARYFEANGADNKEVAMAAASLILSMEAQIRNGSDLVIAEKEKDCIEALLSGTNTEYQQPLVNIDLHQADLMSAINRDVEDFGTHVSAYIKSTEQGQVHSAGRDSLIFILKRLSGVFCFMRFHELVEILDSWSRRIISEEKLDDDFAAQFSYFHEITERLRVSQEEAHEKLLDLIQQGLIYGKPAVLSTIKEDDIENVAFLDTSSDKEMLVIFCDETRRVIAELKLALVELKANPSNLGLLSRVRRSFHTMKGSSRMVNLLHFGEFSWEMEQLLNQWIKVVEKQPVSQSTLQLIEQVTPLFEKWINEIKAKGWASVTVPDFIKSMKVDALAQVEEYLKNNEKVLEDLPPVPEINLVETAHVSGSSHQPAMIVERLVEKTIEHSPVKKPVRVRQRIEIRKKDNFLVSWFKKILGDKSAKIIPPSK